MSDMESSKGGCLRNILIGVAVIFILGKVFGDSEEPVSVQNTGDAAVEETETVDTLEYLYCQNEYARQNEITLNSFSLQESLLANWLDTTSYNPVYMEEEGSLANLIAGNQFKITENRSKHIYLGQLKNNYAHGYGMLLTVSDLYEDGLIQHNGYYYNLEYIGKFEDGRFEGFGIQFHIPDGKGYSVFQDLCPCDKTDEEYLGYFTTWINYAEYWGMFDNGKREGKGNEFSVNALWMHAEFSMLAPPSLDQPEYGVVTVGKWKDNEEHGECTTYIEGKLYYDGEMENGKMNGYGVLYDLTTCTVEYKGNFKNDMRHGQGTSYDTEGNIIYKGEWAYDDYK